MYRPYRTRSARRGNTLIVTLSCLALLAVVGLTAVYFTSDQAKRTDNESQPQPFQDFTDNGMGALNAYIASLMYGQNPATDPTYLLNSTRGYELTRTMYSGQVGSTIAWDGVGTFDETTPPFGLSRRVFLVNHRLFPGMTNVVDPEFTGTRLVSAPIGSGGTFIPKNPAYTYPDAKDLYLASIVPATGEILSPSYYRSWLFRDASQPAGATGLEPIGSPNANPNWMSPLGKFLTLRPRPAEHPNFPIVPADADGVYRGDVRNLPGGYFYDGAGHYIARNDSIWIDIGLPAFTTPSGKRLRPLIAPLILDLDSYLNLNVHGNVMAGATGHASGQGYGAWEVSLQRVLGAEGMALVNARGIPQTRGMVMQRSFSKWLPVGPPSQQLPAA
ncbi:MAG TPA: hypothetical protein VLM40_09255, partial [Gemmata sp.]|nr:hypothetical protein [Gemmata sp.]